MTAVESCELLVDTIQNLRAVKRERDGYRLALLQATHLLHEQHGDIERLRAQHAALHDELRRYVRGQMERAA